MATSFSGSAAVSAANGASASGSTNPLTDEARAGALWTFIHAQAPRFTFDEALQVVRSLRVDVHEDIKVLTKRLRKEMQARRVALRQVHALHAAAQLMGQASWHAEREPDTPRLRFHVFEGTYQVRHSDFASWSDLASELRVWVDALHARGQLPLGVLALSFTGRSLNLVAPVPKQGDEAGRNEMWPLGAITPVDDGENEWLLDAPVVLEKLRRHLEESGKAVLDGYAVLYLCSHSNDRLGEPGAVTTSDAVNSELVLSREPNEDDPDSGYEIARGDELTCWHQLELSLRDDATNKPPERIEVSVPHEGVGAWMVNGERYVWALETLKPKEFVPGRVHRQLGIADCERLLRRYKLAGRIHSGGFRHHDMTKRVDYLSGPPDTWRVDLHRLLHILSRAGLTWESYIEKFGAEPLEMQANLPVGFVIQMLENLKVEEPNVVFARPTLAEMELVTNDKLLYSLLPRVQSVRYSKSKDLSAEAAKKVHEAVDQFAAGLNLHNLVSAGVLPTQDQLPYMLYANDAQELRMSAEALDVRMYVAVSPHLMPTKGLVPDVPGIQTVPWATGHALILRFERKGAAQ